MLAASATWTSAGGALAQIDYPNVALTTGATYPRALLVQEETTRAVYSGGSGSVPRGRLRIELYAGPLVGTLENIADGIAKDLGAMPTGLALMDVVVGPAMDINPSEFPAIDDATAASIRVLNITLTHGLTL